MSIIDKVNALVDRATHKNTTEHEARTSALAAVQLIKKYNLQFVQETKSELKSINPYEESWEQNPKNVTEVVNGDGFVEMPLFRVMIAQKDGTCKLCNKIYRKTEIIAYEMKRKQGTHYKCRRYWSQNIT